MRRALVVFAAVAFAAAAAAQPAGYKANGEQQPSSTVKHRDYTFDVVPPSAAMTDLPWQRFRQKDDAGATILVTGVSGLDSYALAVVTIPVPAGVIDPVALGRSRNDGFEYAVHPANPACAVTPLDKPVRLDRVMVGYYAACLDPKSGKAFELTFSRNSIVLLRGLGSLTGEEKDEPDRPEVVPAEFRATMDRFVETFRFR